MAAADTLRDVPEFFETELGESLHARTEILSSFRELGPPDLCHVIKTNGRGTGSKDVGSYHYVTGVDASSSASLAAYLNSLLYTVEETPSWFGWGGASGSGKGKGEWKVKSGCYCCFNAFSRVDVRVQVRIPGSVEAHVIDMRGDKHEPTPQIWAEVYLSAILRTILYADDPAYWLVGFRKLDPIKTLEDEARFLKVAEQLFARGYQLGSDPEILFATGVSNHLTKGLMKYSGDCFRYGPVVNLFEKLAVRDPEVASLLAKSYIGMNEEVKGVNILYNALQELPQSYALLHIQCDFLRSKGKTERALQLAKQAVNSAPAEFVTWAKLTDVNIELGRYHDALLTLNSCPMFTYNERDLHRMPTPTRNHIPIKQFIADSGLVDDDAAQDNEADVALLRLPAPSLRGTFSQAYGLLARLVSQVGWDELLKCRSHVFVMEEEYRMQKAHQDVGPARSSNTAVASGGDGANTLVNGDSVHEDKVSEAKAGSTEVDKEGGVADENASTKALHSNQPSISVQEPTPAEGTNGESAEKPDEETGTPEQVDRGRMSVPTSPSNQSIPTIRVSSESDHERERLATKGIAPTSHGAGDELDAAANASSEDEEGEVNGKVSADVPEPVPTSSAMDGPAEGLVKPHAVAQEGKEGLGLGDVEGIKGQSNEKDGDEDGLSFSNKRLCERWLDNLFMVLYEDLRVYTIWRAEVAHYKATRMPYRKTGTEWEILGDLAKRLHHKEEAKDAYQRCIESKFSAPVYLKLLEFYTDEGDIERALKATVKLTAYQHRWYMESSYPSAVGHELFKLIKRDGIAKVSNSLVAMGLPPAVFKNCLQPYFDWATEFKVEGCDF